MKGISKTKSFLLALIIIIGLIFLNFPGISSQIKNFSYSISNPVQGFLNQAIKQMKNSWEFLNSLKNISQENIRLEERIKELMAQNTKLKEIEKENEFLRSYLDIPSRQKYKIDLANVTGRDFQGLEQSILLDKGSSSGIEENMTVIAFENILAGTITEVFDDFSKVRLITSPNSRIAVLIQESRAEGLVRGIKGNFLSLDLIAKDINVEKGQTVVTSGVGGIIPKGVLIGKISAVESEENEMFQRIEVAPSAELEKLERVFIITNEGKIKI